jgi:hypothetical protein
MARIARPFPLVAELPSPGDRMLDVEQALEQARRANKAIQSQARALGQTLARLEDQLRRARSQSTAEEAQDARDTRWIS